VDTAPIRKYKLARRRKEVEKLRSVERRALVSNGAHVYHVKRSRGG